MKYIINSLFLYLYIIVVVILFGCTKIVSSDQISSNVCNTALDDTDIDQPDDTDIDQPIEIWAIGDDGWRNLNVKKSSIYSRFRSNADSEYTSDLNRMAFIGLSYYIDFCYDWGIFHGDSVYCNSISYLKPTQSKDFVDSTWVFHRQNTKVNENILSVKCNYVNEKDITYKNASKIFHAGGLICMDLDIIKDKVVLQFYNNYDFPQFRTFVERAPYNVCQMYIELEYKRYKILPAKWYPITVGTKITEKTYNHR